MHERTQLVAAEDDATNILYSDEKESAASVRKFFGMLDSRRAAAREAIAMVLKRTDAGARKTIPAGLTSDFAEVLKSDADDR